MGHLVATWLNNLIYLASDQAVRQSRPMGLLRCFFFLFFFFAFSLTWDHMGVTFQSMSPLKVHSTFTPQIPCMLLGTVSVKLVKRIMKFRIVALFVLYLEDLARQSIGNHEMCAIS